MAREKSPLTEPIMSALGKILKATINENITEDIIRTLCRNVGIAAVAQLDLSYFLKDFRATYNSPKEKLEILADIVPEGLLTALLLVAQEFVNAQVSHVYQADMHAKGALQNKIVALENGRVEACSALSAKESECQNLAKQLALKEAAVLSLTEQVQALKKKNSYLQGRIEGNQTKKQKVRQKGGGSRARAAAMTSDKKNNPQREKLQTTQEPPPGETTFPSPSGISGAVEESMKSENSGVYA